jgi:NADPH-dependent glutamate synthase beta subunit-like oxidoreductase
VNVAAYTRLTMERCRGHEPPPCQAACPLHIDNRQMAALVGEGRFGEALAVVKEKLPFPRVLGRICTHPCESVCKRRDVDEAVAICELKRFVADRRDSFPAAPALGPERRERVAIVGGGPAGLMAAITLRRMGYPVTLFEAESVLGGAVRLYIPRYRLPREVVEQEFHQIVGFGVQVRLNTRLGRDLSVSDLRSRFHAVLLALGTHASVRLKIPGEGLSGVYTALDLLKRVNSDQPVAIGSRVAIIGGGDVAIDAARTVRRLGASQVTVFYRRSAAEMRASPRALAQAKDEQIRFHYLVTPKTLCGGRKVQFLEFLRVSLGPLDGSRRRRPLPVAGSEFQVPVDNVVVAVGQTVAKGHWSEELPTTPWGTIQVNPVTLQTRFPEVFAAGDVVGGADTAVNALAAGRHAALAMDGWLRGRSLEELPRELASWDTRLGMDVPDRPPKPRQRMPLGPVDRRIEGFDAVALGFSEEAARVEARRCLSCECRECVKACGYLERHFSSPLDLTATLSNLHDENRFIPYACNLCGLCAQVCPEGLDIGAVILAARDQLVTRHRGPLPVHRPVLCHQRWSTSKSFILSRSPRGSERCEYVFFPGCGLAGYSPVLVSRAYDYLRQHLPDTGIVLNCCGAPTRALGDQTGFQRVRDQMVHAVRRLGSAKVILACPDCQHTIKAYAPELEATTLYQVMARFGPPTAHTIHPGAVFSIHDSCVARHDTDLQDSVRVLIHGLGYSIEEMNYSRERARCCGSGGMAWYADPELLNQVIRERAHETPHDIVTYCAGCRSTLASAEKPTLHILDLFFNPSWWADKSRPPTGTLSRWLNRGRTKIRLQNSVEKGS